MNSTSSETGMQQQSQRSPQVVQIELLGASFSIRTDESPDYIRSLVAELKERYARLTAGGKVVDPLKLAILTNILTLDEMRRGAEPGGVVARDYEASTALASMDRRLGELGL